MELTNRQKKLLGAAARKIYSGKIGEYKSLEDARPYYEAVTPIIRDAVLEAAPEIPKAEAACRCAPCLTYLAGVFVGKKVHEAIGKDDRKAAKKHAAKAAAPKKSKGVLKVCRKAKPAKKTVKKDAKAGTELDLFRKATKKVAKAALILAAAALLGFAGRAAAQCPGGNCSRAGYTYGYGYTGWGGWYWPGFTGYYYQTPAAPAPKPEEPAPADETAETQEAETTEEEPAEEPETAPAPVICPIAQLAIDAVNRARTGRGLPPLTVDPELCAACERHSAIMAARGFGHAPDGGRECIATNYATPAATVAAWLGSSGHAAIILGPGTKIGIGVFGRFYTLRIR